MGDPQEELDAAHPPIEEMQPATTQLKVKEEAMHRLFAYVKVNIQLWSGKATWLLNSLLAMMVSKKTRLETSQSGPF